MKPITFGSFCSGIGAPEAAWSNLGWKPKFFSEIEPFPCSLLAQRYPAVQNLGDMTEITDEQIESAGPVDVVVAGTPCQSFSVAGLRGGLADARGNLAIRYVELLGKIRPARMVWENVPGVLSSWSDEATFAPSEKSGEIVRKAEEARRILDDGGYDAGSEIGIGDFEEVQQTNDFDQFATALVGRGYSLAWGILDAQYFGVAQRRERVFVVGSLGNWTDSAAILFDRECLSGNPAPSREAGARLAASLTRGADSSGNGGYAGRRREDDVNLVSGCLGTETPGARMRCDASDNLIVAGSLTPDGHPGSYNGQDAYTGHLIPSLRADISPALKARDGKGPSSDGDGDGDGDGAILVPMVTHSLRADGFDASEDCTGRGTPLVPVAFNAHMSVPQTDEDLSQTLQRKNPQAVAYQCQGSNVGPMGTMRSGNGNETGGAQHAIAFDTTQVTSNINRSNPQAGDPCHTLAKGAAAPALAFPSMAVRRLMPVECEKLQGFEPGYTDVPFRKKPASDSVRYRAIGNSMCVNVLTWIGKRIEAVESLR